jgi:hypothetical protein
LCVEVVGLHISNLHLGPGAKSIRQMSFHPLLHGVPIRTYQVFEQTLGRKAQSQTATENDNISPIEWGYLALPSDNLR